MSGMNGVFAKRRARLLAMKAIRDNHIPGDKAITCPKCGQDSDRKSVAQNLSVCPKCGYHFPIGAYYRLSTILDPGSFRELFEKLPAADPLSFPGYRAKVEAAQRKTGLTEAVVTATGTIGGRKCVVGVLDSRFFMGSMSAAVGEKITLAIEYATKNRLPLILFAAGGASAGATGRRICPRPLRRPRQRPRPASAMTRCIWRSWCSGPGTSSSRCWRTATATSSIWGTGTARSSGGTRSSSRRPLPGV